jgi:hypothetical protein
MEYFLKSKMKLFPINGYYNENSMVNVLSLYALAKVDSLTITFDSPNSPTLHLKLQQLPAKFHDITGTVTVP